MAEDTQTVVTVDLTKLTFDDLRYIIEGFPFTKLPAFLDRVVVGGSAACGPLTDWPKIMQAIWGAVDAAINPVVNGKN